MFMCDLLQISSFWYVQRSRNVRGIIVPSTAYPSSCTIGRKGGQCHKSRLFVIVYCAKFGSLVSDSTSSHRVQITVFPRLPKAFHRLYPSPEVWFRRTPSSTFMDEGNQLQNCPLLDYCVELGGSAWNGVDLHSGWSHATTQILCTFILDLCQSCHFFLCYSLWLCSMRLQVS